MGTEEGGAVLVKKTCLRCRKKVLMSPERDYCFQCAMARSVENATQLHSKSGKFYDRWKLEMRNAVKRL